MQLNLEVLLLVLVPIVVLVAMFILNFTGLFPIFRWLSEVFDLSKRRRRVEELEYLDRIRKENLDNLNSYISFKISYLTHNLKIPAPSVDFQVMINNFSLFDIKLKKFIYQPSISGVRSTMNEYTYDGEIEIPHQDTKYFDLKFTIPNGIATYLENCKRKANGGKHGKLTWFFKCTAYIHSPSGEVKRKAAIKYIKEWYEINLPKKRFVG